MYLPVELRLIITALGKPEPQRLGAHEGKSWVYTYCNVPLSLKLLNEKNTDYML